MPSERRSDEPRRPYRVRPSAVALGLLLTVAAVWLWAHEGHEPLPTKGAQVDRERNVVLLSPEAGTSLGLRTAEAVLRTLDDRLTAPATVHAPWQSHAHATSPLGGKIAAVHARAGQRVAAGQVLAEVQSLELEAFLLDLAIAQTEATLSGETRRQLEAASERGAVPEQHLLEARSKHQDHVNALDIARRKLLAVGLDASVLATLASTSESAIPTLPVRSLISGVLTHGEALVGQVVEPSTPLFEITDLDQAWVKVHLLEKDLTRVRPGLPFELHLTAYPDPADLFRGTLTGKGLVLDLPSHLGAAWAEVPNPGERLLAGMFGQARVLLPAAKPTLVVPTSALVRTGIEHCVFVEEGPGQYARQNVVVGRRTAEVVEVLKGNLVPGDRVVTTGSHELASFFVQQVLRPSPEAAQTVGLRVEPVQRRPVAQTVRLSGTVELPPDRRAVASARLAGTLYRIHVGRDQVVQTGDIIAEVASLELQNLQLELLRTHLQMGVLRQTLESLQPLAQRSGAVSARQLREVQSAYTAALLKEDSLRRRLTAVGLSAAQVQAILDEGRLAEALPVRAPLKGAVVRFRAALGQAVKAEDPLFEIHDVDHAMVRGYAFEKQLSGIREGQPARVRLVAEPGFVADAVVARAGRTFSEEDRTLSVWLELRRRPSQPLLQGMLARLTLITGASEPLLAVPLDAVLREGSRSYVFVRRDDGSFERRPVETGRADDLHVEITRGLREAEPIAVQGVAALQTALAVIK